MKNLVLFTFFFGSLVFGQRPGQDHGWEQHVNAQTGTTYTYVTGDFGKLITHSNAAAIAGTLPQCGSTGFTAGSFHFDVMNTGAGTLTITPTTSTIDGVSTLVLTTGSGAHVVCDGTNWNTWHGGGGGSNTPGAWQNITGGAFSGGWTQQTSADTVGYRLEYPTRVCLRGVAAAGTVTGGTVIFNIAAGWRPLANHQDYLVPAGGVTSSTAIISITAAGDVTFYPQAGAGGAYADVGFQGICFPTN